ncbi:hypothetical protein S245_008610 [Arachis hypogaea]
MAETRSLYRLNGIAHVTGSINKDDDRSGGDGVGHADHRVRHGRPQRRGGSSGGTSAGPGDRPAEHATAETQEVSLTHVSSSQIYHDIHG